MPAKGAATEPAAPLTGHALIKAKARRLPTKPGVYRMLDQHGDVLYVGKARNLKSRVGSYAAGKAHTNRITRMITHVRDIIVVTTETESQALLLEAQLIKRYMPPNNVLLRDDKSFPYILIRTDHEWPQIRKHRGAQKIEGHYFGPFASAKAVNSTLNTLQRAFLLRSCSDGVFSGRTRPCLLYQIKRCSAPCVDRISSKDYTTLVDDTRTFLGGRSQGVQRTLSDQMNKASEALEFERAAALRDRIKALTSIQGRQGVTAKTVDDADVIAAYQDGGQTCVQVFFLRGGQNWGNRAFFPRHDNSHDLDEILTSFVGQFYDNKPTPKTILISHDLENHDLLEDALTLKSPYRVHLLHPKRGDKAQMVDLAVRNARDALSLRIAENASQTRVLEELAEIFELDGPPQRIESYDNSHISGTNALGAMVVAGPDGFQKNNYRKFNIKDTTIAAGDDYAMMREVLTRRFGRLMKEDPERARGQWPDLVLIDGGAGQLSAAMDVLEELGIEDLGLVAIAKGPDRNAGRERFFMPGRDPFTLDPKSAAMYYLQRLRDEVHRFAIGSHRTKRAGSMKKSLLDGVPGIGPKRKKALLQHFGSAKAVSGAALEDLDSADGINSAVARKIYDYFHPDG
ncbi:MAG: excinuclease ABC subunit UvrC [Proteobacteria bacterium]|nr:excinuclease ABC subunit UvrC [Pseudomonadota bacterium]